MVENIPEHNHVINKDKFLLYKGFTVCEVCGITLDEILSKIVGGLDSSADPNH